MLVRSALMKLRLAFEPGLEEQYRRYQMRTTIRMVRLALSLTVLLVGGFAVLDLYIAPTVAPLFWAIRFTIAIPAIVFCIWTSFQPWYERCDQILVSGTVLVVGVSIAAMIMISPPPGNQTYYAGLILVLMAAYTLYSLRFVWATMTSALVVIIYEVVAIGIIETPLVILINNNFFFVSANIMGMLANYSLEFHSRRDFINLHKLSIAGHGVGGQRDDWSGVSVPAQQPCGLVAIHHRHLHIHQDDVERVALVTGDKRRLNRKLAVLGDGNIRARPF